MDEYCALITEASWIKYHYNWFLSINIVFFFVSNDLILIIFLVYSVWEKKGLRKQVRCLNETLIRDPGLQPWRSGGTLIELQGISHGGSSKVGHFLGTLASHTLEGLYLGHWDVSLSYGDCWHTSSCQFLSLRGHFSTRIILFLRCYTGEGFFYPCVFFHQ